MKFLCDVHISYKIADLFRNLGYEAIHINDILNKSETKDSEICKYADEKNLIVLTKDSDFRDSFFIKNSPKKLIKINLGNISNQELKAILTENVKLIEKLSIRDSFLLEIDNDGLYLMEK